MSFSGDEWGRPQPSTPPDQQPTGKRGSRGPLGCYLAIVVFLAACTAISFAVSKPDSRLLAWLFLALTVLAVIVPLLLRNITRATRRKE